jgi:Ala-tRNA(Pro) deacylase
MKIQELLRQNKVPFEVLDFPAHQSAAATSAPPARVILLRANHGYRYLLAVIPADQVLDLHQATRALDGCDLSPAGEGEQKCFCPNGEVGRLMPFGSHYDVRILLDESLAQEDSILFTEIDGSALIRMKTADYRDLEHPFVLPLTRESCGSCT